MACTAAAQRISAAQQMPVGAGDAAVLYCAAGARSSFRSEEVFVQQHRMTQPRHFAAHVCQLLRVRILADTPHP